MKTAQRNNSIHLKQNCASNHIELLFYNTLPIYLFSYVRVMSGLRFLNKVTIVTGGSKGIGAGIGRDWTCD